MKKKITLNELRTIINQRVMKLVENHLNDVKSLEDRLYYFMGADGEIDHNDLLDVASETGLNPDDETFIMALAGARARKKQEKNDELKSDIQYVIASEFGGDAPASFGDFYAVFDGQHFDQQYDKADVFKLYKSMTTDPNQLALFENKEENLPYGTHLLNYAGIPNLLAGISNIQNDIKNSISEYEADTVAMGGTPEEAKQKKIESIQNIKQSISMLINDLQATSLKLDNGINYLNKR